MKLIKIIKWAIVGLILISQSWAATIDKDSVYSPKTQDRIDYTFQHTNQINRGQLSSEQLKDQLTSISLLTSQEKQDYGLECNPRRDEKRQVLFGNLTLKSAEEFEKFRCLIRIKGDLVIDARYYEQLESKTPNYDLTVFVLPWLKRVDGNLILKGAYNLADARFPRLNKVGNTIYMDYTINNILWWMPNLINHHASLNIRADSLNNLTGFESLSYLKKLYIWSTLGTMTGPNNVWGLNALSQLGDLEFNLKSYIDQSYGSFLSSLQHVTGNVKIHLTDGLGGLSAIQQIDGELDLDVSGYVYNLNDLSSLYSLGHLTIENTGLQDISELMNVVMPAGGVIKITNNNGISNCQAKQLVRALRNDPNWNVFNDSKTMVSGNGYPDCL